MYYKNTILYIKYNIVKRYTILFTILYLIYKDKYQKQDLIIESIFFPFYIKSFPLSMAESVMEEQF